MNKTTAALRLEERRYAWSLLRNSSDADDLVQDCLVRAWARIGTIRTEGDLRPWLFTIMHNVFATRWRRTKRRANLMPEDREAEPTVAPAQEAKAEMRDVAGLGIASQGAALLQNPTTSLSRYQPSSSALQ